MTFEPGPTCIAFCAKAIGSCGAFQQLESDCRQACEATIDEGRSQSEACGDAYEAGFACVSELECQGVYDWRDRTPPGDWPCRSAAVDVEAACESI